MTDQTVSIEIKAVKTAAPENDAQTQVKEEEEEVNLMISRLESDKLAATTVLAEVSSNNSTFTQWQSDRVSSRRVCVLHFLHFSNFQCRCVCHHIDHGCE